MFKFMVGSLILVVSFQFCFRFLQAADSGTDPGFAIEGTVTDFNGRVVEGATLEWGYWLARRDDREFATTDENGHYRLVTNKQGPDCRLGVSMTGFAPNYRDGIIPTDKVTNVDFTLLSPLSVRGILVDSQGKPHSGRQVDITSESDLLDHHGFSISFRFPGPDHSTTTDENGRFLIRDLPGSPEQRKEARGVTYNLNVREDGKILKTFHVSSKGENRLRMSQTEWKGKATLEHFGRVVDENGRPISSFWTRDYYGRDLYPQTQSTFRYRGKYGFHIHAPGYETRTVKDLIANDTANPVDYRLAAGETLNGRVTGRHGAIPKADVLVGGRILRGKIDWISSIESPRYRLQSDKNGRFSIYYPKDLERINPLIVGAPGYCWKAVDIDPRQGEDRAVQHIQLTPSLPVIRVLARFANKPAANDPFVLSHQENELKIRGRLDESGSTQVDRLPPGVYGFSLSRIHPRERRYGTEVLATKIEITEGGPTEFEFENPANGITVSGSTYPFAIVTLRYLKELGSTEFLRYADFQGTHIFGTLADASGNYEITGLKPGDYVADAWNVLRTHPEYRHWRTHLTLYNLESDCKVPLLTGATLDAIELSH